MRPNSEINEVHTSKLGADYGRVAAYLSDRDPHRRRSYREYLDGNCEKPVYALNDSAQSVTFQSECLVPRDDRKGPKVLLLFSNAHPESIKNGMFHTAEGRVAALWTDLRAVRLFSGDPTTLKSAGGLRDHCLNVGYEGPFALGFACYWLFPTFHPDHLKALFGQAMEPPGLGNPKDRLNRLLARWQPKAIISFNGKVFEHLTGTGMKGYTNRLRRQLIQEEYPAPDRGYPVFQTYPTGWRYHKDASGLRQASLDRIANAIHRM